MIDTLTLEGFRGFQRFELADLGRINLLVGTNNCGKTSLLEAVQLFSSSGDASSILHVASRRGERVIDVSDSRGIPRAEADVCHLFYGHEIDVDSSFSIKAQSPRGAEELIARIAHKNGQRLLLEDESLSNDDLLQQDYMLELEWNPPREIVRLPVSSRGGISLDAARRYQRSRLPDGMRVNFISTAGLTVDDIVGMFEEAVLTPKESLITEALQTIEPSVERLAAISGDRRRAYPGERGGIVVKCRGSSQRTPIGSMGDGMWRMLGISLAIASAENGILLVDEIDTGLHFSVMGRMWKLVDETSRLLNVQVFATTHSRDAYESLAAISADKGSDSSHVMIHRIDRGADRSIAYSEQEIIAAAERGIEVR